VVKLVGHVDLFKPIGGLSGWIVDLDNPGRPAAATLLLGGEAVANFTATTERPDVVKAGHAAPVSGFAVAVPSRYFDGRERAIAFRAADGGVFKLNGLGVFAYQRSVEGEVVVSPDGKTVSGWAVDPISPGRQLFVDLSIDGRHVTTMSCVKDPKTVKSTSNGAHPVGVFGLH
jgi:hypothetical protein